MRSPSRMSSGTVEMPSLGNAPRMMASKHLYLKWDCRHYQYGLAAGEGCLTVFLPITQIIHAAVEPGLSRNCIRAFQLMVLAHDTSVSCWQWNTFAASLSASW